MNGLLARNRLAVPPSPAGPDGHVAQAAVAVGEPLIRLRGVTKTYGSGSAAFQALRGVDLDIAAGEFVAVMGPSGSGKSTAMNILGCLDTPTSGAYRFRGVAVQSLSRDQRARLRRRWLGFVFQGFNLLARTTALENVEFGLELQGVPAETRRGRARALLDPVGLRGFEARYPRELSGGMKQRVAIARALALDAPILLMDEPFGALDEQTRLLMGEWLLGIWARTRKTVVFVTHSLQEAILLSQRIVVMTARPGRIKASFAVDLPAPRDLDAAPATTLRRALWDAIRDESRRALDGGA